MRPIFAMAAFPIVAATGCGLPVCAPGWLEADGQCIADDTPDPDPKCEVPCEPQAHEVCDTELEPPSCVCAPGYGGNPCVWVGVLRSPGFDDDLAWSQTNGAVVDPNEPRTRTDKDPGIAFLRASVVCNGGAVSQTVEMPPYGAAQALIAEVTYQAENVYGLGVGYNDVWRTLPSTGELAGGEAGEWVTKRICLGDAAYGGEVKFQVGAVDQQPACFTDPVGEIKVDRLVIVPANQNECPPVGEVLNGEAEESEGGWVFIDEETGGEDTEAVQAWFDPDGGRSNTSGARIYREAVSSGEVGMSTQLSVPLKETLPSPALRFWWKGTTGNRFHAEIGTYDAPGVIRRAVEDFVGNGGDTNFVYCLPPWTHGNVVELGFSILLNSPPQTAELIVDDVEIVSDPNCGEFTTLFDPGFESAPNRTMGVTTTSTDEWVEMREDSELARNGNGVLELGYKNANSLILYETWVLVPPSEGAKGPALVVWYDYADPDPLGSGTPPVLPVRSVVGRAASDPRDLLPGADWTRHEICLPPEWSDRWFRVQFRVGDIFDLPAAELIDPPTRIYLDDFEVKPSATCPAK